MELLDRYQPLFLIGRGGMGTIEVAVERGSTGIVALKRMLPGVRDKRHIDMFMREARLATLLNHENVVHAFAFGQHEDELLFAMEYVEGETLAALVAKQKQLPLEIVAHVLADVCEGLHAAHELRDVGGDALGVVHRDVSPHNVMLSYRGEVKVLDFGVAKLDSSAHLTKTGEIKGKTAYMSPEQAMGDALDRRSDLYGVGAMLFELVVGRRMWEGETDLELLRQLALAEPPKLADAAPNAPPALHDLHARLVAKKAKDRPATAHEVAEALRDLAGPPAEARQMLAKLLADVYAEETKIKRARLEEALAHRDDDPRSVEPGAVAAPANTPRASRVAPWLYAFLGAAIASTAVLLLARNKPIANSAAPSTASVAISSPSVIASSDLQLTSPARDEVRTPAGTPTTTTRALDRGRPRTIPVRSAAPPATSAPVHPPIDVDTHPI